MRSLAYSQYEYSGLEGSECLPVLLRACQLVQISNLVIKAPKLAHVDGVGDEFCVRCKLGYGVNDQVLAALREKIVRQVIEVDEVGECGTLGFVNMRLGVSLTDEILCEDWVTCRFALAGLERR